MKNNYPKLSETKLDKNTVIVRANLNLKFKNGEIDDDSKIKALIPTLTYLQKANCKTIILTHVGDECGEYTDDLSLIPLRFAIGRHLNKPVKFVSINNCQNSIKFMEFGDILLLENLCFSPEEFSSDKKTKTDFINNIAQFAEYYIDESFGVDQTLASTSILPKVLPTLLGINYEEELKALKLFKSLNKEDQVSVIGGKISDEKIKVIEKLIPRSKNLILGGEIAMLFLKIEGININNKNITPEIQLKAEELVKLALEFNCEINLPLDVVLEDKKNVDIKKISTKDIVIGDIGEKTIKKFQQIIENSKSVIVNGTMGIYEDERFWKGTNDVFETIALLSPKEYYKIIGGEDTMEAIKMLKIKNKKFNHTSTGIIQFILSI